MSTIIKFSKLICISHEGNQNFGRWASLPEYSDRNQYFSILKLQELHSKKNKTYAVKKMFMMNFESVIIEQKALWISNYELVPQYELYAQAPA